jgi:hypothetical protein
MGRGFWAGLILTGYAWYWAPPIPAPSRPSAGRPDGPPPAHPERLATHVPPSPTEARLWRQFGSRPGSSGPSDRTTSR